VLGIHLREHGVRVRLSQHGGAVPGSQRCQNGPPEKFLHEGGGHALGRGDDAGHIHIGVNRQVACVQPDQALAAGRVRPGDLNREVHPPWPVGQRLLKHVGAVGGEHERDVRVRTHTVHGVQQREQQRPGVLLEVAVHGDQVDVLEHHHRRLQPAGQRRRLLDETDRLPGQQDHGRPGQPAGEVAHGVGLAGARRAVQQKTALEVLARCLEFGRELPHADDVLFDRFKDADRQHDVVRGERRSRQERDQLVAVMLALAEAQHLAAENVVLTGQPRDLRAGS
jgi:hypothetical protein